MTPPRKKSPIGSDAAEMATSSKCGDDQRAKERPSTIDRDPAKSDAQSDVICPFATFTEWAFDADQAAYGDL
ncbi:MAG: hypothetical protein HYS63_03125 [Methylocystis sp.]|nr:hypothetical protein [Methylocystis sp.]